MRKIRGFTLIELLVVIAIIGILVTVAVPNFQVALNRSKQKSTMKDIKTISTAIADYVTDNGVSPTQEGSYDASATFYNGLSPFYIKVLPINDHWGNGFRVWCGNAVNGNYGISGVDTDDFMVASFGRDKTQESNFTFDPDNPGAGFFVVDSMEAFGNDLVVWNGAWIRCPGIPAKRKGPGC